MTQKASYREKYLKRAKMAAAILRWVPFLKMAGLNGSVVRSEEKESSDIDFLIIARAGRLYTARLFATLFIHLTGWRRHGDKIAGRICLNCYLSEKNPDITPRDPKSRRKVARAYKYLIPLVDAGGVGERFFENNQWFAGFAVPGVSYQRRLIKKLLPKGAKKPVRFLEVLFLGKFGDWVEAKLMNYQKERILYGKKRGDETVATRREIRLHPKKH